MWRIVGFLVFIATALVGFGFGSGYLNYGSNRVLKKGITLVSGIHPDREFPPTEFKSFAVVLYAQNDADWCERSLRSIFEQDYEYFRLLLIDDGSIDGTLQRARDFIIANSQQHRVIVMHNETPSGYGASIYRAVSQCLDRELIVPMSAKDWMAGPTVLSHWNRAFQNPDVWIAFGRAIAYPSYDFREPPTFDLDAIAKKGWGDWSSQEFPSHCFYSAIFKQISVQNLRSNYLTSLLELSGGRMKNVWEPVSFVNETGGANSCLESVAPHLPLSPLKSFPKNWGNEPLAVDVVAFSHNNPLGLFAALESLQQNISGLQRISVVFWADEPFMSAYAELRSSFPDVHFKPQGAEFKRSLFSTAFETPAQYILFCADDAIVKEAVDLTKVADLLDRTRADAFLFTAGKTSQATPLTNGVYAGNPTQIGGLEMTLYRKSDLVSFLKTVKYQNMQGVASAMKNYFQKEAVCLSFDEPKSMPLSMGRAEELLSKFNQGLKLDVEAFLRGENQEFIER